MTSTSQRSKQHGGLLSKLDVAIQLLSNAKDVCGIAPAQVALGSACVLLTAIRVRFVLFSNDLLFTLIQDTMGNKQDFVDLGLFCAKVCGALDRGLNGKRSDELSESTHEAIEQLRA